MPVTVHPHPRSVRIPAFPHSESHFPHANTQGNSAAKFAYT